MPKFKIKRKVVASTSVCKGIETVPLIMHFLKAIPVSRFSPIIVRFVTFFATDALLTSKNLITIWE
jgi:hypothetical protein